MDASTRRKSILKIIKESIKPISAGKLAEHFSISRQVIVGDIALLRASGHNIIATPRGYLISPSESNKCYIKKIVCKHNYEEMKDELYAIVDCGCSVKDVIVEHPIYGQLTGELAIQSRYDADKFLHLTQKAKAKPLSFLTEGIHIHTLICPSEEAFIKAKEKLKSLKILFEK